jgi:DNA-binding transcriptional LysR family regulator
MLNQLGGVRELTMAVHHGPFNLIKELRAFCVTKEEESISKAAEVLFSSQPTVSLQIKNLENELGIRAFERRGPKLKLTTQGQILYNIAQPLVQQLDHLKENFDAQYGDLTSGSLTVAAEESTILYILPEVIRKFTEQYPGIKLKISNVTGRDGKAILLANEVDFLINSMLGVPDSIEYTPFVEYPPVLITQKDHPLAKKKDFHIKDIENYGLILPPAHYSSWQIAKMVLALQGVNYKVAMEAGGWEVVKRYVGFGLGIAIVTDICFREHEKERLHAIPLTEHFPKRKYGVAVPKNKILSAPARRFIEILKEHYQEASMR